MKKICFVLALCLLVSCFSTFAVAENDFEVVIVDGIPCVKDEMLLSTSVFFDPNDYTNEEGVDLLGVRVVKMKALFPCETESELEKWQATAGDVYPYAVTTDGEIALEAAIKILSEQEDVISATVNAIIWIDEIELGTFTAADSPINEGNIEEAISGDWVIAPEFVITVESELDMEQFGGEEKGKLFGVGIERIEKIASEDGFSYSITVDSALDSWIVKRAFECADGITSVKAFSKYGNGDVNKDGEVDKFDYIFVKRLCLGTVKGLISQLGSSDVNRDGTIDKFDYILVKRQVLGTYKIAENMAIE